MVWKLSSLSLFSSRNNEWKRNRREASTFNALVWIPSLFQFKLKFTIFFFSGKILAHHHYYVFFDERILIETKHFIISCFCWIESDWTFFFRPFHFHWPSRHVTSSFIRSLHFTSHHFTSSLRFIIISIDDACKGVIIWACSSQAPATPKLSRRLRNNEQRWITWLLCCVIVSQSTVWMLQLSSWWLLRSVWFEDDRFHFLPCLLTYAFLLRSFVDLFDCLFVCLSTFLFL